MVRNCIVINRDFSKELDFSTEAKPLSLGDYKTTTKNFKCQEKKLEISKNSILYFSLKNTLI
jgi:hypothetical protein